MKTMKITGRCVAFNEKQFKYTMKNKKKEANAVVSRQQRRDYFNERQIASEYAKVFVAAPKKLFGTAVDVLS